MVINRALSTESTRVEVSEAAEQAWVKLMESSVRGLRGNPDCTPGYYNNEGRPVGRKEMLNGSGYPEGAVAYFKYIDGWRNSGNFAGLEFS